MSLMDIKFEKNYNNFVLNCNFDVDEKINGIAISGIITPRFMGDFLNTNWGSALVRFTRESDGKFFDYQNLFLYEKNLLHLKNYHLLNFPLQAL